ncbi:MAG: hypothetical protein HY664_04695 [Chloroflexi bacterium]|nr:hypothetical protein [Chloroflexota bacterium]
MSPEWRAIVLLVHLVGTLFMAAPLYMLVVVNERARFGVPIGYFTDRYMENIIKNQPPRCYAYLAAVLVSGLVLVNDRGWDSLTEWPLLIKVGAFIVLTGLLSYVHFGIQPRIEAILDGVKPDAPVPPEVRPQITALRIRRKRLAGLCLFLVLTAVIMGLRVMWTYNTALTLLFLAGAALFAWRAYKAPVPYGWV